MAKERSLWQRCLTGIKHLEKCGHHTHFCRLENSAGEGNPDVEGCIEGAQCWIELKSNKRPKRSTTVVRSKTRESQSIWHRARTESGSRMHWVLIQVGEAYNARLYLIPGCWYDKIIVPEAELTNMSVLLHPNASLAEVLLRACQGW
jgi:hypothetical protein